MAAKPAPKRSKARILVVDDHPIVRQGLVQMIGSESDLEVCGQAESAAEALRAIAATAPDAAIVDLSLKGSSGLELLKDIKVRHPRLPVLVLSVFDEAMYAERALRAGARGYMMKEEAAEKVLTAVRRILAGQIYLSDTMAARLLHNLVGGRPAAGSPAERLSDRELEVFGLIGQGYGNTDIAHKLHLSPKTVETYRGHIKVKLNLTSSTELLQHAIQWARERSPAGGGAL
ncbi:MAG: response regulator transcription factor [Planctomycetes bacterium]|nr:response regulator transcription factor [Planctomycetota bacterium]